MLTIACLSADVNVVEKLGIYLENPPMSHFVVRKE